MAQGDGEIGCELSFLISLMKKKIIWIIQTVSNISGTMLENLQSHF